MSRISLEEIKSMTLSYAILMWHKRQSYQISTPVEIHVAHIRNRFESSLWARRIEQVFDDLAKSHPYFRFNESAILEYFPQSK
jgi:hypothetical protein